jgi:hypothetical protein
MVASDGPGSFQVSDLAMKEEPVDGTHRTPAVPNTDGSEPRDGSTGAAAAPQNETDRYDRALSIPPHGGIFVNPQLTIDPNDLSGLTDSRPRLESKISPKESETPSVLASKPSPPPLGIDDFCC